MSVKGQTPRSKSYTDSKLKTLLYPNCRRDLNSTTGLFSLCAFHIEAAHRIREILAVEKTVDRGLKFI